MSFASTIVPIASITFILNGLLGCIVNVAKSLGRSNYTWLWNLLGYYCVALPSCYIFAFQVNMGLQGIFIGILCGVIVLCCIYGMLLKNTNWYLVSHRASLQILRDLDTKYQIKQMQMADKTVKHNRKTEFF